MAEHLDDRDERLRTAHRALAHAGCRHSRGADFHRDCNGFRPRRVQTAEGELAVEIPQVREAAEPFVSKLFPRGTKLLRTEPLRAMVIGAFVRGLSMRDVESLCDQAGLGKRRPATMRPVEVPHASISSTFAGRRRHGTPRTGAQRACGRRAADLGSGLLG